MREPLAIAGVIRRLWPAEAEAYSEHMLRLDAMSRHMRFGGAVDDATVRRHGESVSGLDAVVHGFFAEGVLRGAAELRRLEGQPGLGEAAFSVERDWQGQGVGATLVDRTLLAARNRGVRRVYVSCLPANGAMQRIVKRLDAVVLHDLDEVTGLVSTGLPSFATLVSEWIAEGHGMVHTVIGASGRGLLASPAEAVPAGPEERVAPVR